MAPEVAGTIKKECGNEEKVYRALSLAFRGLNKEHWCIYCICKISLAQSVTENSSPEAALRKSWKALRFLYPNLSIIPEGFTKLYLVPDSQNVEEWATQTFFVELAKTADQIVANYTPRDLPSLHYLPASSELLFMSSHWRIDGVGTCMLLDRFFRILANPPDLESISWAAEARNLSPSMEDAVGPAEPTTPAMEEYARVAIEKFHRTALNNSDIPYKGGPSTLPGASTRSAVMFSKKSTSSFVSACKAARISVTAAIHAALAETVFSLAAEDQTKDYTTVMSVDLRKYLQPQYRSAAHACQTYVSSIAPTVLRKSTFKERTAALMLEYSGWHTDDHMRSLRLLYKYHAEAFLNRKGPPPTPPSGVLLSSLGVVEQYITGDYDGAVQVEKFNFGVTMMTRQMLLYPWSFQGHLHFSVNYNEAYYDARVAQEVLTKLQNVLEKELGTTLDQIQLE